MDDGPARDCRRDPSPRHGHKRLHTGDGVDERHVKRRGDGRDGDFHTQRRRSRSPRPSEHADHDDHDRHDRHDRHGDGRNSRGKARPREVTKSPGYGETSSHWRKRSQSRSPDRHRRHRNHHRRSRHAPKAPLQGDVPQLPCDARALSRSTDFDAFRPLFARYLDIQKQIDIATLDEREVRGRWKSFVGRWNNGELAEGWYRPEVFEDVMLDSLGGGDEIEDEKDRDSTAGASASHDLLRGPSGGQLRNTHTTKHEAPDSISRGSADTDSRSRGTGDEEEDDDDYGPSLPGRDDRRRTTDTAKSGSEAKHGPGIPAISDLALRRELEASDLDGARSQLRQERRVDRALQRERLDELAPRANAGSRERRLEKRRDAREANAAFANARSAPGDVPELADADLMGGGGGVEEYKKLRREAERRKTEREIRREEIERARREEREGRIREYRAREANTVDMLREIARSRFG